MKRNHLLFSSAMLAAFAGPAFATTAPSIQGEAKISVNIKGAILNVGAGASGFTGSAKQAVASVLDGTISGSLTDNVDVKGAILNVGAGASGAKVTSCQSVGTVGSDCGT